MQETNRRSTSRILASLIIISLVFHPLIFQSNVYAQAIVVDPSNPQVGLDKAQNGVPVVNIAAPNAQGLSHNKFTEFNVEQQGLILNNSNQIANSVLGGALYNNPNLANGAAGAALILNEVTGVGRTNLNGFTEVFGRQADYVVANPNGISCNGCGFINTGRTTLSTGRPEIENGFLKNLNVQGGDVSIWGEGLNAENTNYFEIISRTASIQGQVNAKDFNVVTGRNDYDYQNKAATAKADAANGAGGSGSKPELSIDASSLGSLYSGRIKMISTEAGVGVKLANDMVANASDLIIDAKGNVTYKNLTAAGNVNITSTDKVTGTEGVAGAAGSVNINAGNINNSGEILGQNSVNLSATDDLTNSGDIKSNQSLTINSGTLNNSGSLLSGILAINSNINNSKDIIGNSIELNGNIFNSGKINGWSFLGITTNNIDNKNGELNAGVMNKDDLGNYTSIYTPGTLTLNHGSSFTIEGKYFSTDSMFLTATGDIENKTELKSLGDMTITSRTGNFVNTTGSISAGVRQDDNDYYKLDTYKDLTINAKNVTNKASLNATKDLTINSDTSIYNNSNITSANNLLLKANNGQFTNDAAGNIYAKNNSTIISTGALANSGSIKSDAITKIESADLTNNKLIYGTTDLNISATGNLINNYQINSDGTISLLKASGYLQNNSNASLYSVGNSLLDITGSIYNEGTIKSDADLNIFNANNITNNYVLFAGKTLKVTNSNSITNNYAIVSFGDMELNANDYIINSLDKYIYAHGNMSLYAGNYILNDAGKIKTEGMTDSDGVYHGDINIVTRDFTNNSRTIAPYGSTYFYSYNIANDGFLNINQGQAALKLSQGGSTEDAIVPYQDSNGSYYLYYADPGDDIFKNFGIGSCTLQISAGQERWLGKKDAISLLTTGSYSELSSAANLTMTLSGTLNNISSDILAVGKINIQAAHINNVQGTNGQEVPTYEIFLTKDPASNLLLYNTERDFKNILDYHLYGTQKDTIFKTWNSWVEPSNKDWYGQLVNNPGKQWLSARYVNDKKTLRSNRFSKILAGGDLTLSDNSIIDGGNVSGHTSSTATGYTPPTGNVNNSNIFYSDVTGNLNQQYAANASQYRVEIKVDGMFYRYANGKGYVIETNPLFTDVEKLKSSDYFINRLGYNRDQFNTLFMGDAYWEKEYLAKQIQAAMARRFVADGLISDEQQRELLFANAEEVAGDLKLRVGIALSEEQRKALTKPIVWYVEQEQVINGKTQKVLMPIVYLPLNYEAKISSGGVLSGSSVTINTNKDVQIAGAVYASNDTNINANNFSANNADLKSKNLNINVSNDLNLKAVNIAALQNATLYARNNINIEGRSETERGNYQRADGSHVSYEKVDYIGSTLNVGGNLTIGARNFTSVSTGIEVGGNADFNVLENTTFGVGEKSYCEVAKKYEYGSWSAKTITDTYAEKTYADSTLKVGGHLNINTGKDLNLIGTNISANTATIDAKGDINVVSVMEEKSTSHSEVSTGITSMEINETTHSTGTNKASSIATNGNLDAKAGGDVNMYGSNISSSKGDVNVEATNVNMVAAKDIEQDTSYHKKVTYFSIGALFGSLGNLLRGKDVEYGSFKEGTKVSKTETAVASNISGNNVNIKTRNDLNMVGSNISASENTNLDVGHDFNMLTVEQLSSSSSTEKEGKLFANLSFHGVSSASLKAGVKYTEDSSKTDSVTNASSNINTKNLTLKTGNDFVTKAANINVQENADIDVKGSTYNLAAKDTTDTTTSHSEVRTGVELKVSVNPLAVVDGVKNVATGAVSGAKAIGSAAKGDLSGTLNNSFGGFNTAMAGVADINKSRARNQVEKDENGKVTNKGQAGKLDTVGVGLNYFFEADKSESTSHDAIVKGSNINVGGHLKQTVAKNMTVSGSNIQAGSADIDVKGNLDVKSEYDEHTYNEQNVSVGMSVGLMGAGMGQVNGYVNGSKTNAESKWVNNQSGINTTNKLNVKVGGNTNLEGSYINSESGDLNLDTKTLTHSDMKGYDKGSTIGGGTSMGVDFIKNSNGSTSYNVNAPSRTNIKYGMHDKEQITRSTVGTGTITVGGKQTTSDDPSLAGLNRDMSKRQEITKDTKVDLIDVDIDHRLLTEKGRTEIKNQVDTAAQTVKDVAETGYDYVTGKIDSIGDKHGVSDKLAERYNREDSMAELAKTNPEAAKILANKDGDYSIEDKQAASSAYNELLLTKYGLTPEEIKNVNIYDNKSDGNKGFRNSKDNTIHMNAGNTDLGKDDYAKTLSHEQSHAIDAALGYNYSEDQAGAEKNAEYMEQAGLDSMNRGLAIAGTDYRMGELKEEYQKKLGDYSTLIGNTSKANLVPSSQRENKSEAMYETESEQKALVGHGLMTPQEYNKMRIENSKTSLAIAGGGAAALGLGLAAPVIIGAGAAAYTAVDAAIIGAGYKTWNIIQPIVVKYSNKATDLYYNLGSSASNFDYKNPSITEPLKVIFEYQSPLYEAPKTVRDAVISGAGLIMDNKYGHSPIPVVPKYIDRIGQGIKYGVTGK